MGRRRSTLTGKVPLWTDGEDNVIYINQSKMLGEDYDCSGPRFDLCHPPSLPVHPPPLSPSLPPYFSLTAAALIEGELETGSHRRVGACLFIRTSRLLFLSFFSPSPSSSSGLNQKPAPPPPIQHNFSRSAGFRLPKSHLPWNPSVQIWRRWAAVQPPSGGEEGGGGGGHVKI